MRLPELEAAMRVLAQWTAVRDVLYCRILTLIRREGERYAYFVDFKELLGDEEVALLDHSAAHFDRRRNNCQYEN
jgi:hypothetical protein